MGGPKKEPLRWVTLVSGRLSHDGVLHCRIALEAPKNLYPTQEPSRDYLFMYTMTSSFMVSVTLERLHTGVPDIFHAI